MSQALASNGNTQILIKKAQACLEKAVEVPGAPLFHMGNIAVFNSKSSFELMQAAITIYPAKQNLK
jgi:hypothetical protein